jgi:hypothetical protein
VIVIVQAGCAAVVALPDRAFVAPVDDLIPMDVAYKGLLSAVQTKERKQSTGKGAVQGFFGGAHRVSKVDSTKAIDFGGWVD